MCGKNETLRENILTSLKSGTAIFDLWGMLECQNNQGNVRGK